MLEARNLSVRLDGTPILRDLTFALRPGTWTGLVGPNGSGKTTLLRTLIGLLPYEGTLRFDGPALRQWSARALAHRIAYLQQTPSLTFALSVRELVRLGRAPHKAWLEPHTARDRRIVREALDQVDMASFAERSVLSLSGGELQRALLAQALAQEADMLLLDEPTTHLDVRHQLALLHLMQTFVREGRTVLAVFHDLELAARYADTTLVLDEGRLAAAGPPQAVLTPDLLASVFRVEASVQFSEDTPPRIEYADVTRSET